MIDEKKLEDELGSRSKPQIPGVRAYVSRLEDACCARAPTRSYRINPIQFATEKAMAEAEGIDLFLHGLRGRVIRHGTGAGLSVCYDVVESFEA